VPVGSFRRRRLKFGSIDRRARSLSPSPMKALFQARSKASPRTVRRAGVDAGRLGGEPGLPAQPAGHSRAAEILRESSTRVTAARIATLALLLGRKDALSAAGVHEALGVRAPDRVTIYRSLEALAERGLISVVVATDRIRRYVFRRTNGEARVRFRCSVCRGITVLPAVLPILTELGNCSIERQTLSVSGVCSSCR
jgi:Fur family ferric uptake transcriptional regulator